MIALCAQLDELERAYRATRFDHKNKSPESLAADAERNALQARQDTLVERISETPARTLEGVQAVARSLVLWEPDSLAIGPRDNGEVLLNVILQNLPKLGALAPAFKADAKLVGAAAKFEAIHHEIDRFNKGESDMTDDQSGDLCSRSVRLAGRLAKMRATTWQGLLAKAMAAQTAIAFANCEDQGSTMPDAGEEHDQLAWSALNDLVAAGTFRRPFEEGHKVCNCPDAELIRTCHQFAETELTNWYRYCTLPADVADAQDPKPDWSSLHWITATPATTPEGWRAKALAYSAWHHEPYDDLPEDRDTASPLLAALLRDMVAPVRNAIVARLAEQYGPLPEGYTAEGIWVGVQG